MLEKWGELLMPVWGICFDILMSLDSDICEFVIEKSQRRGKMANTAAKKYLDVFRYLRLVSRKDILYYYKEYSDIPIFSSTLFHVHWTVCKRWREIIWTVKK